ncbi:hypothetical protein BJY59DRAFT_492961 [Rhodotorula toruloides]
MPTLFRRRAVSSTRRSPYHTDDESDAPTHSGAEDEHVVPPSMSSAPRSALRTSTTRSSSRPKMVRVGTDGSNEMSRARAHAPGSMSRREIREEVEDIKRRIASLERASARKQDRRTRFAREGSRGPRPRTVAPHDAQPRRRTRLPPSQGERQHQEELPRPPRISAAAPELGSDAAAEPRRLGLDARGCGATRMEVLGRQTRGGPPAHGQVLRPCICY